MRALLLGAIAASCLLAPPAHASADWFDAGDIVLRLDLQLLNDAGVIRLPSSQWPMPRAALENAVAEAREHFATNNAVIAALGRARARVLPPPPRLAFGADVTAGEPGLLRDFNTLGRDRAELAAQAAYTGERTAARVRLTAVADPRDGRSLRADGSHATLRLGNWLLSANELDRWWGPSQEGSLILSSNARPMPTVMVERAVPRPFESPWLSWLGPWRFSFGISQMESEREDIDRPLFMAWRVVVMPFRKMEIGFSRTAQFCGRQLACNLDTFGNMLAGNDNVGIDATPENEPGNQMAGFDMRWTSPIGSGPYALYSQMIGEDESSYLPAKYLSQYGAEVWKPFTDGGVLKGFIEYTSTTCSANTDRGPYYNCAYNQGRFDREGYRYLGRVVGFSSDRDAENYSLGVVYLGANGAAWTATLRDSRLNRDDFNDTANTVSASPMDYQALELGWQGKLFGGEFAVDLGFESLEPAGGESDRGAFGFVRWRRDFEP